MARRVGAEVIEIPREEFSHGGTRNLLMERAQGEHVAFLTQDSAPADERWLEHLLGGFSLAADVGLTFGPYRPRPEASPMVRRELTEWFRSLSPGGSPRIDRLEPSEQTVASRDLRGARGFFTDANGCVAKAAWHDVPFRAVEYAEDHVLAHDMLRAGYTKVFVPRAAVVHSHDYSAWEWLRRSFDEARAVREIYGFAGPPNALLDIWGRVGADWRWRQSADVKPNALRFLATSTGHHVARVTGAWLGARADRLPETATRRLSLEGRGRTVERSV
jgi:rhamnosyltransferase